ncbi:MAG: Rieske (2Fe-2S) protein, partial [Snowella sp.]
PDCKRGEISVGVDAGLLLDRWAMTRFANGAITCPFHRSSFNLCSGAVEEWITWPPVVSKAMSLVSSEKNLKVFPTRLEDGNILIDIEA